MKCEKLRTKAGTYEQKILTMYYSYFLILGSRNVPWWSNSRISQNFSLVTVALFITEKQETIWRSKSMDHLNKVYLNGYLCNVILKLIGMKIWA